LATNPTRAQQQACNHFAEALALIAEGSRLDGKGKLDQEALSVLAGQIASASSAFTRDEIVSKALEFRIRGLGLRSGTIDLLTLLDTEISPLQMLALTDAEFRELVAGIEAELGDL
jgi:hypothetical protein